MIPYIKDEEELDRELADAKDKVVLVCLSAGTGGSDNANKTMDEKHNELKDVLFYKVDVEDMESGSLVERCAPEVVPCFIFYRKSKEIDRVRGKNDEELALKIE